MEKDGGRTSVTVQGRQRQQEGGSRVEGCVCRAGGRCGSGGVVRSRETTAAWGLWWGTPLLASVVGDVDAAIGSISVVW